MNQEQHEELPKIDSTELPLFSSVSASTCNGAETTTTAAANSHHQMQYCDACNTACVFMNGRQRKLQVRYEGYVLVKRGPAASSFFSPYVTAQHAALPTYERRHSFAELPEDQTAADQQEPPVCTAYTGPPRTSTQLPWRKADEDTLMNHHHQPPFEKLVNLAADENRVPVSTSASSSSLYTTHNSAGSQGSSNSNISSYSSNTRLRREKKNTHQRLCRKKSRSQDNLTGRRVASSCVNEEGIVLNNTIQPPPLTCSPLSRSEGSIHNVHATTTLGGQDGEDGTTGEAGEGICGGVGELARLPKKLLTRVTDEVGQWVFDLEGWNEQYLTLNESTFSFRNSCGYLLGREVPYSTIEEVQLVMPSGAKGHKYCIRLQTRDTSLLLQASSSYTRDQWLHSILWKKNAFKYRNLLRTARRPEVLLKELKNLVDVSLAAPLHDPAVCQLPLDLASSILTGDTWLSQPMSEEVIVTLAPLLENNTPSPQICSFFSKHCCDAPRSTLVIDMFTPVVRRILKHNVDFGKYPHVRRFVQNYVQALNSQNAGERVVHGFVRSLHGPTSTCPHLRVLPNLVAVCTAAINSLTEMMKRPHDINTCQRDGAAEAHMACYISLLALICEYDDWRVGLAALLQPVPFPDDFLADPDLMRHVVPVIERIGRDPRCEVHQLVASSREHKEGWLQLLCPSSIACIDEGTAWANVLEMLISCCCRRKKFLATQAKSLGAFMLLALRNDSTAQEVLCLMLEWRLLESSDLRLQVVTTLQSTPTGKRCYQDLCDRQMHLRELQQKGGPRKLTLPSRSTDADVIRLLSSGSFGNLQVLSLAFTRVTSECAHHLIKLPDLRYLNLWATQFGDQGLQLITEHLHKLQVLNLCETPVTDLGLSCLTALKNLRKLNLNSTSLSAVTFQELKAGLPNLQEVDVRYTDAW